MLLLIFICNANLQTIDCHRRLIWVSFTSLSYFLTIVILTSLKCTAFRTLDILRALSSFATKIYELSSPLCCENWDSRDISNRENYSLVTKDYISLIIFNNFPIKQEEKSRANINFKDAESTRRSLIDLVPIFFLKSETADYWNQKSKEKMRKFMRKSNSKVYHVEIKFQRWKNPLKKIQ